jgi:hypothetical protein
MESDTRSFPNEPPGATEPGSAQDRSALRPVGHDSVEPLGADLRSDTDAREQPATFAPEFDRGPANRKRLGFGPEAVDVAELELPVDGDQGCSTFERLDGDVGSLRNRQRQKPKHNDANITHGSASPVRTQTHLPAQIHSLASREAAGSPVAS